MSASVAVGLIGAGWIGRFHGESVALRIPGTRLVAVADPAPGAAASLIERVSPDARAYTDALELIADPTVEAVLISTPASTHTDLVVAAAEAGKHVFCEKPMALTLEDADRAIGACAANNVALQVGFNRRFAADFAAAHDVITSGGIGTPQLLRSLTRDPGITADVASRVKPWTIFNETLIHDFDALLWLNPGHASSRCSRRPMLSSIRSTRSRGTSIRRWFSCGSTTAPSRRPRPTSRPPTVTTFAARFSVPVEW